MQVDILPLAGKKHVDDKLLKKLASALERRGFAANILPLKHLAKSAMNSARNQYNAAKLLPRIDAKRVLAVTPEDLFENGFNFVFGLGDREGSAVVSYFRLRPEYYGEKPSIKKLTSRLVKEALHEIGHTLGLKHCGHLIKGRPCVMSFSSNIHEVDKKEKKFCPDCKAMTE